MKSSGQLTKYSLALKKKSSEVWKNISIYPNKCQEGWNRFLMFLD